MTRDDFTDYQSVMLPLLRYAADEQEHSVREAIDALADQFRLTDEERKELLPSGGQATFDNRVGWARTYMKKAGLLESPRRSYFKITDRCLQALKTNPESINNWFLQQYPEFRSGQRRHLTSRCSGWKRVMSGSSSSGQWVFVCASSSACARTQSSMAGRQLSARS